MTKQDKVEGLVKKDGELSISADTKKKLLEERLIAIGEWFKECWENFIDHIGGNNVFIAKNKKGETYISTKLHDDLTSRD